ncbi:MAG: hypothetical protein PHC94_09835, partial [Methylobacter sp.]|nr:hypothetical protein [Methylobacter sp.]
SSKQWSLGWMFIYLPFELVFWASNAMYRNLRLMLKFCQKKRLLTGKIDDLLIDAAVSFYVAV